MAGPELVMAATIGSAALGAGSEILKGKGEAEGYRHKEVESQRKAFNARTAADQTDAYLREELDTTLGNIDAIRAAAGVSGASPTGQAIAAEETRQQDRTRKIKTANLTSQATQSELDAQYFRGAAKTAQNISYLNAGARALGAFAPRRG